MITAAQPVRTGNSGIVPPWLQRPVGAAPAGGAEYVAREQARAERVVEDVRARFAELGVRDDEGNDSGTVRFNPRFPNASYTFDALPQYRAPADSVTIGVDQETGRSYADATDVVAHEWGHRIVDHMTHGRMDMTYGSIDPAIHESLADTFAAMYDTDDWELGEDLGAPIRVMDRPEVLGHPGHVDQVDAAFGPDSPFVHPAPTSDGDVLRDRLGRTVLFPDSHVLAAVPNKAATIIGDSLGRDTMAKIYIDAVREHVRPGQAFGGLAAAVIASADQLFGADSREATVTRQAWDAVGLLEAATASSQVPSQGRQPR